MVAESKTIINIAGYQFVTLDRLHERRRELRQWCSELRLRGTILLASEGINLFLAGERQSIDTFLARLREDERLASFEVKESPSIEQPFRRMLVRVKKEIIAFGVPQINPEVHTSRRVTPHQLKTWLDEGTPLTLLDVRNDYEIELGTFRNAVRIGVNHFRHFPEAAEHLPEDLKHQRVVTFCTGGIRCEKAAPYLEQIGFQDVYQLDGGILKYFEDCGDSFYEGDCFVFDHRVSVDPRLEETAAALCFVCQAALTEAEQQSPLYEPGESCPHCYRSPDELQHDLFARRRRHLQELIDPLPGSIPYSNRRPIHVSSRFAGLSLLDFLCRLHPHVDRADWEEACREGRIRWQDAPVSPDRTVVAGEQYLHVFENTIEPDVNANVDWIFEDDWLVVVNKPAPLPMHPCGRFNRNTLVHLLEAIYRPLQLRVAHRLDANTSGVVVLSKTRKVASMVQPQFEQGVVRKEYLACVVGHPPNDEFENRAPIGLSRVPHGGRVVDPDGQSAETRFEVLARHDNGTALIRAIPVTGRTNQIRIHLWDLGFPVFGDPLYLPNRALGDRQSLSVDAPAMRLHARSLALRHPATGEYITFEAPLPKWC